MATSDRGQVAVFSFKFDPEALVSDLEEGLRAGPARRVVVPDVVGSGVRRAAHDMAKLGLEVRTEMLEQPPAPVEGRVARQVPPPGKKARRGSKVTLFLDFPTGRRP